MCLAHTGGVSPYACGIRAPFFIARNAPPLAFLVVSTAGASSIMHDVTLQCLGRWFV